MSDGGNFRQAYAPPPPWYAEVVPDDPPPPIPRGTYTVFGWPRLPHGKTGVAALPMLDSDTALFSVGDKWQDLRTDFRRVFKDLVTAYTNFLGQLSLTGDPSASSVNATCQQIMKMHRNLQHILGLLRYWEAREAVVQQYRRQLGHKNLLISQLKDVLRIAGENVPIIMSDD